MLVINRTNMTEQDDSLADKMLAEHKESVFFVSADNYRTIKNIPNPTALCDSLDRDVVILISLGKKIDEDNYLTYMETKDIEILKFLFDN